MRRLFRIRFTEAGLRRDLDDEIAFHIESRVDALVAAGADPRDAREQAEREYGDVAASFRELYHVDRRRMARHRREEIMHSFVEDLRFAARGLARRPALTGVIVAVLTIGIAANAVMFGVVDQLLLRPPAGVANPDGVKRIYFTGLQDGKPFATEVTTYPAIAALRANVPDASDIAAHFRTTATVGRGADAEQVDLELVSGNYFRLLGVRPQRGRAFVDQEDALPSGVPVAIVSDGFWRTRLGEREDVVGSQVELNNRRFTIVGVAPRGFTSLDREKVDLWVPIAAAALEVVSEDWYRAPNSWWVRAVMRVRPGAPIERAQNEAAVAYRREYFSWGEKRTDSTASVALGPIVGTRTPQGISVEARVSLWLMGVAFVVLLIACANVANLLIARMLQRRREIAVRLALGISRARLVRLLLTESALLAALASVSALVVTHWGARVVQRVLLPGFVWSDGIVDARVLLFTCAVTVICIVLAGTAPALQSLRTSVTTTLHGSARQIAGGRSRMRTALLVAQAALSVVLLVGAGLFVKSLRNVVGRDVGVTLNRVSLVSMNLRRAGFQPSELDPTFDEALRRVRAIPGVESASLVAQSIPMRSGNGLSIVTDGPRPRLDGGGPYYSVVRNDFFGSLGAAVRAGRAFTDEEQQSPSRVMLVNQIVADAYWPGRSPVGECVKLGSDSTCTRIVGVVQNIILFSMVKDDRAMIYLPPTHPGFGVGRHPGAIVVRASGDPAGLTASIRKSLQGMSPRMPYVQVSPFMELLAPQMRPWRLGATMFTIFGVLALVIAVVGLYSVMSYWVSQRTHEIGVRVALGARQADVVRLVARQGSRPIVAGVLLGAVIAFAGSRWVESMLYETSPHDPLVYLVAALALLASGILAVIPPARRSAAVDPAIALRAE